MTKNIIPIQQVALAIRFVREERVLLDFDLARLRCHHRQLKQSRQAELPPISGGLHVSTQRRGDKIFDSPIWNIKGRGGRRHFPYAFTEQGVAMLSSVLNSERAVKVNIAIMRAFVKLRQTLETNRELARKFEQLERRVGKHDEEIAGIIEAIRQLMAPPTRPRREIGFHVREKT